jgi:hypothetical protein
MSARTALWRDRDVRLVIGGQAVSSLGDAVSFTAFPLLVLALTGSGTAMGIVGVLQTLPDLLLGLPAGAWADRWDRRRTIILADLGRALLTALIPLSAILGWDTMTVLLLVTLPLNALRVIFMAAWTASIPMLVGTDRIARAQGAMEAIFSVSFILGPALAGVLVSLIGPVGTIGVDALSFAISAGAMALVRRRLQAERTAEPQHLVREIGEGVRYLVAEPVLRMAVLFFSLSTVITAPLVPALIFFLTQERGEPASVTGLVLSGWGVGWLVGALVAGRVANGPAGWLMLGANAASAAVVVAFVAVSQPFAWAALSAVAGSLGALSLIPYVTLRSTITPNHLLGRVSSTARMLTLGVQPVGLFLGGLAIDAIGGRTTVLVVGLAGASLSLLFVWSRALRTARIPRSAAEGPAAA